MFTKQVLTSHRLDKYLQFAFVIKRYLIKINKFKKLVFGDSLNFINATTLVVILKLLTVLAIILTLK